MRKKILISMYLIVLSAVILAITFTLSNKEPKTICDGSTVKNGNDLQLNQSTKPAPQAQPNNSIITTEKVNHVGNTVGNILNGGYAAEQGNWVYFNCNGLCKVMLDMKIGWKKLVDCDPMNINVIEDWIYYTDQFLLYKIKTDGTNKSQLLAEKVKKVYVTSSFIYFIGYDDNNFYRINIDGTNKVKLSDKICSCYSIENDWIYFNTFTEGEENENQIIKMKSNTSNKVSVFKGNIPSFLSYNDTFYYPSYHPSEFIKVNKNGTNAQNLKSDYIISYNVSKDYLFFIDSALNINKANHTDLTSSVINNINNLKIQSNSALITIQDYILLYSKPYIYKISLDGKIEKVSR